MRVELIALLVVSETAVVATVETGTSNTRNIAI
jgi:hypothetical protein